MSISVITQDEAREGWLQSVTCREVELAGRIAGHEYGTAEATARNLATVLARQAKLKFGTADAAGRATLDGLANAFAGDTLFDLGDRLLTANSWAEWLAGVTVPPPAPPLPSYTNQMMVDFEPAEPSTDSYIPQMTLQGPTLLHTRVQKWYQPDLDKLLYEGSRKKERESGMKVKTKVILMWPPAEGPGMTGVYKERDARGSVIGRFDYEIRRAWLMRPEEAFDQPFTTMVVPMTKGAKGRMPEILRMIDKGLTAMKGEPLFRESVFVTIYWTMGLVWDLEECRDAMDDWLPLVLTSQFYRNAKGAAFLRMYSRAIEDGRRRARQELIVRQATIRFGPNAAAAASVTAQTEPAVLDELANRVLTAADWAALVGSDRAGYTSFSPGESTGAD